MHRHSHRSLTQCLFQNNILHLLSPDPTFPPETTIDDIWASILKIDNSTIDGTATTYEFDHSDPSPPERLSKFVSRTHRPHSRKAIAQSRNHSIMFNPLPPPPIFASRPPGGRQQAQGAAGTNGSGTSSAANGSLSVSLPLLNDIF